MDRKKILIVDDNKDMATSLARLLRVLGHDVEVVFDGCQVLEAARTYEPQFILLDIGLPGLDGYGVARLLRDEGFDQTIIAAVSGHGLEEDHRHSLEAGMDVHLTKPVDVPTITSLLSRKR